MDTILGLLRFLYKGDLGPYVTFFVFAATVLLVLGATIWLFSGQDVVRRRLSEIAGIHEKPGENAPQHEGAFDVRWTHPIVNVVMPREDWKKSRIRSRLVQAGYRQERSLYIFMISKILLGFSVPLLIALPLLIMGKLPSFQPSVAVSLLVLAALIGYYLPDAFIERKRRIRQLHFTEGFPDAMDMLVVCVEAGLGLDAAIQRVGREIEIAHPELSDEFTLVSLELRAGKGREEALRSLGERTGVEQVQSLTSLLIQAEHFGTSIASALREHANEMRTMRLQKAKERAAKLPVKMVFPILFFIFPALFLVILGPALVRIYTGFITTF
jgi:tight adherence protein C